MKEIVTKEHDLLAGKLRDLLATYKQNEDLINIGAYKKAFFISSIEISS